MNKINYGKHQISRDDINEVVNVLKSDFLTQGPIVKEFEENFSKYIGVKYAVAVSNGTAALHLCNLVLNVSKGTKVITTPLSFVATSNSVLYCGGEIEFCDIDPNTLLIDIKSLEKKLNKSPKGTYSGIIPVDFAGYPVQMDKLKKIADQFNLWIIEDSCHAPGGYFIDSFNKKQTCGNGVFSDLSIFSFHPVKHFTCGEGGMITTNNKNLYEKLIKLRSHGISRDDFIHQGEVDELYYEMQYLGFNYRLSDINAALGKSQLKRANLNLEKRKNIALKYDRAFSKTSNIKIIETPNGHAYHLYVIRVKKRNMLYGYLKKLNINCQIHYIPIYRHPFYENLFKNKKLIFKETEKYYKECLSIPIYPSLSERDQNFVISSILNFYK